MRKEKIWLTITILGLLLLALYSYLGGFNPIEVVSIERKEYQLIGNYYEGEYDNDTIGVLFFKAKELIQEGTAPGTLTIVNYAPKAEGDTVSIFVGVLLEDEAIEVPQGLESRTIKGGQIIQANIRAHHLVMPSRDKVDRKLEEFVQENNLSLKPLVIEQYRAEDHLQIERIVQ